MPLGFCEHYAVNKKSIFLSILFWMAAQNDTIKVLRNELLSTPVTYLMYLQVMSIYYNKLKYYVYAFRRPFNTLCYH